ncbi:hypothetical protein AX15_006679, partial [Amanita polypyramis BW_CC]
MVNASLEDNALFPPKCCNQPLTAEFAEDAGGMNKNKEQIQIELLGLVLDDAELGERMVNKWREWRVPGEDRVYCSNSGCSLFLGSATELDAGGSSSGGGSELGNSVATTATTAGNSSGNSRKASSGKTSGSAPTLLRLFSSKKSSNPPSSNSIPPPPPSIKCTACQTSTCISCKQPGHAGKSCSERVETQFWETVQVNRWKQCPGSSSSYVYILESDIDIPTQLLIAKLTLTDLSAHLATLNHDQTRSGPADDELALKQQESELRMWVTCLQDLILARSIDRAVATDRELVRALEVMERSAVEDRRAAEMLQREDRLPGVSEAQRVVGTRNFVIPEVGRDEDDTETVVGSLRPATSATGHTSPSRSGPRLECVSCADRFPQAQCLTAPCNHIYCHGCLVSLVESCVRDETLYPVKCCRQPFPIASLNSLLNVRLRLLFEAKLREYNVPPERRVYCSNPRCSSFLGSATEEGEEPEDIICGSCRTATCASCKQRSHSGSYCPSSVTHSEVAL